MPRKANDGRGRLGGRKAGTPNKDNPLKTLLRGQSMEYFSKNIHPEDISASVFIIDPKADNALSLAEIIKEKFVEQHQGEVFSQFDIDRLGMRPSDRAKIEVELLAYHTPKMQAIAADMTLENRNNTFEDRLASLAAGDDVPPPSEQ